MTDLTITCATPCRTVLVVAFRCAVAYTLSNMLRKLNTIVSCALVAVLLVCVGATGVAAQLCDPATEQELSIKVEGAREASDPGTGQPTGTFCLTKSTGGGVQDNPIILFLKTIVQFLIVGIGIGLVGGLVFGGLTYMTARANAQQVQKAEEIIRNTIIGIALYIFAIAIVNFLIPGGVVGS